jgi:hypothetical protein
MKPTDDSRNVWVIFCISGENLNLPEIKKTISVEPDYFHGKNTKDYHGNPVRPYLQYNSILSSDSSLEEHLWSILKRICENRIEIKELSKKFQLSLYANLENRTSSKHLSIRLSPRLMLLLGDLGIQLELEWWSHALPQGA